MSKQPPDPRPRSAPLVTELAFARTLARALASPGVDPEDLLQEGLLRALQRPHSSEAPPRAWLASVFRNTASNARRSAARRAEHERRAASPKRAPDDPAEREGELDAQRKLSEALAALEEPYRSTLVRRYYREHSCAEIAREDGLPESTVRSRLARGIELLRERLDQRHGGRREAWLAWLAPLVTAPPAPVADLRPHAGPAAAASVAGALLVAVLVWIVAAPPWRAASSENVLAGPERAPETARSATPSAPPPTAAAETLAAETRSAERASGALPSSGEAAHESSASPPRALVRLRAVGPDGRPLAAAELTRVAFGDENADSAAARANADAEGRVEFAVEFADEESSAGDVWFQLHAPDHGEELLRAFMAPGRDLDLGDVVLPTAGSIRGRVLDATGAPTRGASVMLTQPDLASEEHAAWPKLDLGDRAVEQSVDVDDDGRFLFERVPVGVHRAWVRRSGWYGRASAAITVRMGACTDVEDLVLARPHPVHRGVVVDAHGAPLAGIRVDRRRAGTWEYGGMTDAAGRFLVDPEVAGTDDLHVWDPKDVRGALDCAAVETSTDERKYVLPDARRARFVVRDEAGAPVTHFSFSRMYGPELYLESTTIDTPDGAFERALPATPFLLRIHAQGFQLGSWPNLDPARIVGEQVFTLVRAPIVRGRVLGADGAPAAGYGVELVLRAQDDLPNRFTRFPVRFDFLAGSEGTRADATGSFELTVRHAGPWSLLVKAGNEYRAEFGPYARGDAALAEPLVLRLPAVGSITGRLLAPAGVRVEGQWVGASFGTSQLVPVRVGADGAFTFERLAPGPWQLHRLIANDFGRPNRAPFEPAPKSVVLAAGEVAHVDLDLREAWAGALRGVFRFRGVEPLGWTAIWAPDVPIAREQRVSDALDPNGAFALRDLSPGKGALVLRDAGDGVVRREVRKPMTLEFGEREIELDFHAATVELEGWTCEHGLALVAESSDGARMTTFLPPAALASRTTLAIPAGTITLHALDAKGAVTSAALASFELAQGASVRCAR